MTNWPLLERQVHDSALVNQDACVIDHRCLGRPLRIFVGGLQTAGTPISSPVTAA